jgi:hypothetical protein
VEIGFNVTICSTRGGGRLRKVVLGLTDGNSSCLVGRGTTAKIVVMPMRL